jgi:hypothetical protein
VNDRPNGLVTTSYTDTFNALAVRHLGRRLGKRDSLSAASIEVAERRLGFRLPRAVRAYYLAAGSARDLNDVHNHFFSVSELYRDDSYLVFMNENQSVVSWGVRIDDRHDDPIVWQRNNSSPTAWYSERKRFTAFMRSMFNWYARAGIWVKKRRRG